MKGDGSIMKKCAIIMNPESGKIKSIGSKKNFYDILRKYGYDAEIKYTKQAKDAVEIVKNLPNDIDLVISAGGDGTLNEVVTGNMAREKTLTIANLPMGTTNDVAHMYGLSSDYIKNLELILSGTTKKVDVCYINDRPFIYVACLGDYIDMSYNTPRELKKKYGKIAYIMYGLKQLRNKINTYNIKYKIDGKEYTGNYAFFFITNSSRVAGFNDIYYDIKLDDRMFEVAFIPLKNKKEMLKVFLQLSKNGLKNIPNVTYYQTNNLELEFLDPPKVSWCIDGEEFKTFEKKYIFNVNRRTKMLLPNENVNRLFEKE